MHKHTKWNKTIRYWLDIFYEFRYKTTRLTDSHTTSIKCICTQTISLRKRRLKTASCSSIPQKSSWLWCRNLSSDAEESCVLPDSFFGASLSSSFCHWSSSPAKMRRTDYKENNKSKIVHKRGENKKHTRVNNRSKGTRVICSKRNLNPLYSTFPRHNRPHRGI